MTSICSCRIRQIVGSSSQRPNGWVCRPTRSSSTSSGSGIRRPPRFHWRSTMPFVRVASRRVIGCCWPRSAPASPSDQFCCAGGCPRPPFGRTGFGAQRAYTTQNSASECDQPSGRGPRPRSDPSGLKPAFRERSEHPPRSGRPAERRPCAKICAKRRQCRSCCACKTLKRWHLQRSTRRWSDL